MNKLILSINVLLLSKVKNVTVTSLSITRDIITTSIFANIDPIIKSALQMYLDRRIVQVGLTSLRDRFEIKFEGLDGVFLVEIHDESVKENYVDLNYVNPDLFATDKHCTYEVAPYYKTGIHKPIDPVVNLIQETLAGAYDIINLTIGGSASVVEYSVVDDTTVHLYCAVPGSSGSLELFEMMVVVKYEKDMMPDIFKAELISNNRTKQIESIRNIDGVGSVTDLGLGIAVEVPNGESFIVRYRGTYNTRSNTIINCHYTNMIIASVLQVIDHTDYRVINDGILNIVIS